MDGMPRGRLIGSGDYGIACMKWPKWSIATGDTGDFLPIMIGGIFLFLSVPAFVLLWVMPSRNSGAIGIQLLAWHRHRIVCGHILVIYELRIQPFAAPCLRR